MAIPTPRLNELTVAVTMGVNPKPKNKEEESYCEAIREEILTARMSGKLKMVEIPAEWPEA